MDLKAEAAEIVASAQKDRDDRLLARQQAQEAKTPDALQALINARLAKSQASRSVAPSPSKDEIQQSANPLERLGTWSDAPSASLDDAATWDANTILPSVVPEADGTPNPKRGRVLIRACTKETPDPEPVPVQRRLSNHGIDTAVPQLGRVLSSRSRSAHGNRTTNDRQVVALQLQRQVTSDRGSSVPPTRRVSSQQLAIKFQNNASEVQKESERGEVAQQNVETETASPVAMVVWAAAKFLKPLIVSGRRVRQVLPAELVLGRDVRRQLRLIVGGLMGSGKSTLCRMLAHLLGGFWVNQDEFSHRGKQAKKAFLEEVEKEAQDKNVPVLIVDKINTMRQHRREILDAMQAGVSGDVVFVQMVHPKDPPNRLDKMVQVCLSRIQGRGEGHRTLMASNPKLKNILKMTSMGVEPMLEDELSRFTARVTVDVLQPPAQSVMQVLADLDKHHLLERFRLDDLISPDRLNEALATTKEAENKLKGGATTSSEAPSRQKQKSAPTWYWTVDFDPDVSASVRNLWDGHCPKTSSMEPAADIHVTLLFAGNASDETLTKSHPHLGGVKDVKQFREAVQGREGKEVEIQIQRLVWDNRIACAEVHGLDGSCANLHPHITLAYRPGVPPKLSNELLSRRAANEDLQVGLSPWLLQLGLHNHFSQIQEWCKHSGAASADEIVENANDLVKWLTNKDKRLDEDRVAAIRQTLAHAAPGNIQTAEHTMKIRGRVRGRKRGE